MVNVTTDALKMVRDALSDFMTDIEGVASRAESRSTDTMNACDAQVSQAKGDVAQSEMKVATLEKILIRRKKRYRV